MLSGTPSPAHLTFLENAKLIPQTSTNAGHLQQKASSSCKAMSLSHMAGQHNLHMHSSSRAATVWEATRQS